MSPKVQQYLIQKQIRYGYEKKIPLQHSTSNTLILKKIWFYSFIYTLTHVHTHRKRERHCVIKIDKVLIFLLRAKNRFVKIQYQQVKFCLSCMCPNLSIQKEGIIIYLQNYILIL